MKLLLTVIGIVIISILEGKEVGRNLPVEDYPNVVCGTTCPSYHHEDGQLGHVKAYTNIGYAFRIGRGVEFDMKKAVHYYAASVFYNNKRVSSKGIMYILYFLMIALR